VTLVATANVELRRKRRIIGVVSIMLMVLFYALEFIGLITFIVWLLLVAVVFLVANFALRRLRRQELLQKL
jgi:uncharacterized membrane protein (DUF485 family)